MGNDYRIPLYVVLGGAVVVYAIFLMPPIISRGERGSMSADHAAFNAAVVQELAHCKEQSSGVNCRCFANRSGTILAHSEPKVPGVRYADKEQLARGQAERGC